MSHKRLKIKRSKVPNVVCGRLNRIVLHFFYNVLWTTLALSLEQRYFYLFRHRFLEGGNRCKHHLKTNRAILAPKQVRTLNIFILELCLQESELYYLTWILIKSFP